MGRKENSKPHKMIKMKFISQRAASLERITGPEGILLGMNRSIQSEGAFGTVKQLFKKDSA